MHLNIRGLISQYGYLALFIGSIAEGETFTLIGGITVHEGLLNFTGVILSTMFGGILGDQLLYWIGRKYGTRIIQKLKKYKNKVIKARKLIKRQPVLFVIGVRFMYGFRIIGPIIIGASRLNSMKFFILNVVGAAIWSIIFITIGYYAGGVVIPWVYKIDQHIKYILLISVVIIFLSIISYTIYSLFYKKYK
ncbi:DedA family protein [Candidatus Pantoea edessiphila]|uniref:DedA family protein n=1 Tax=Candidatus Pantoea edessiphila TaxID=2044610 RepID=A0A2P5SYY5_9GAMM|nr:DedA family protein [Candidatus Pantoea edessiphila]MBK4775314.1 DedA family protein [Pantoea sp. Edef]PPI87549.1 DedA family protein [Candidatus Pantoea edessiphila]